LRLHRCLTMQIYGNYPKLERVFGKIFLDDDNCFVLEDPSGIFLSRHAMNIFCFVLAEIEKGSIKNDRSPIVC